MSHISSNHFEINNIGSVWILSMKRVAFETAVNKNISVNEIRESLLDNGNDKSIWWVVSFRCDFRKKFGIVREHWHCQWVPGVQWVLESLEKFIYIF